MIETLSQDSLERAAELILQADALIVTAGVGMSIDSRQPDLRGIVTATPLVTLAGVRLTYFVLLAQKPSAPSLSGPGGFTAVASTCIAQHCRILDSRF